MQILVFLQIVLALGLTVWLVHSYSLESMPLVIKALVGFTWFINFSVVILLPLDISYIILQDKDDNQSMYGLWKAIYWLNFVLTWVVLPLCQQYQVVGEFTFKQKLKRAAINNLIIYGIMALVGALGIVYLVYTDQFNLQKLSPLLMASANLFGMLLVVVLLSYGLVAIPRSLYKKGDYQKILKMNYFQASKFAYRKEELLPQLELRVKQVLHHQRIGTSTPDIESTLSRVPRNFIQSWERSVPSFQKLPGLVQLNRDIKKMILDFNRLQTRWNRLLSRTFKIQDVLKDLNSSTRTIQSPLFNKSHYDFVNKLVWLWHCRLKLKFQKAMFVVLSLFALAVVIAELSIFVGFVEVLNPFTRINELQSFVTIDIWLLVPLSYIAICIYYGLFSMRLAGFYGLYSNHQTDAPSLIFLALNLSRVAAPMCYNYIQMVNIQQQPAFSSVMGQLDTSPLLGHTFEFLFPFVFILLIVFNSFDVYTKLLDALGLTNLAFEEFIKQANVQDGRKRLQRARVQMQNRILNRRDKSLQDYKSYQTKVPIDCYSSLVENTQTMNSNISSEASGPHQVYFNSFSDLSAARGILDL